MSRLADFSSAVRSLIGTQRARHSEPAPWTLLHKPLSDCTLAIVTGSAYVDVAPPLDRPGVELCSFRAVPGEALGPAPAADEPRVQASDPARFEPDRLGVAVGRARELVAGGHIGRLSRSHLMLTGAVDSRARLVRETRRAAVSLLTHDQVDVALLVPM